MTSGNLTARRRPFLKRSVFGGLLTALPLVLTCLAILAFGEPWMARLAYAGVVATVVVVGLQIQMGNSGGVNFSHTVFVAIGAYAVAILSTPVAMKKLVIPNAPFGLADLSLPPAVAVLAALAIVAVLALVTGLVIVRVSGVASDILTLCLQIIAHSIFMYWTTLFRGSQAFFGIPQFMTLPAALVVATAVIMCARIFRDSPWGVQLRASSENLLAARCFAVNVTRLRLVAWVLSALVCSAGGMIFAFYIGTINAQSFYFPYVFLTVAMLILGGMNSVSGAVVGVLIIEIGIELIRNLENGPSLFGFQLPTLYGLSGLALGAVIVIGMVLRPSGIMGTREFDDILFPRRPKSEPKP
jgi:branched-chain amino acid transport system permease protein